jgi:hypothetical protein
MAMNVRRNGICVHRVTILSLSGTINDIDDDQSVVQDSRRSDFSFGMHVGSMVILFVWVVWDSIIDDSNHHNLWHSSVIAVYRGIGKTQSSYSYDSWPDVDHQQAMFDFPLIGVLILLLWCWCLQLYVFEAYNIAFLRIFEWKNTKWTQYLFVMRQAVSITIVYLVNLLLYYKILRGDLKIFVPAHVIPLMLFLFMVVKFIFPLKQRRLLHHTLARYASHDSSCITSRGTMDKPI